MRDWTSSDEPGNDEGWMEYAGELVWPVGFTSGGAPYGLTLDEFRLANERHAGNAGSARAKTVLKELLELSSGPETHAEVGRVRKIAQGLSRDVFVAEVDLTPDPDHRSGSFVVLLPWPDADEEVDDRARRELLVLGRLSRLTLSFRVPAVVGAFPESGRVALVRQFVRGIELDLRAGRQSGVRPWEILGEIMAAVHGRDGALFDDILPGHATRRAHAEAALSVFDGLDGTEVREARLWAEVHLPPAEPSVLVHGDLLGHNVLFDPGRPPAVIDWEHAQRGDPAYDLAIVTRGVRQPFQIDRGLQKLLEAYRRHGGRRVTVEHVMLFELCLAAGWYRNSLAGKGIHPPDQELMRLRDLLRRAQALPER